VGLESVAPGDLRQDEPPTVGLVVGCQQVTGGFHPLGGSSSSSASSPAAPARRRPAGRPRGPTEFVSRHSRPPGVRRPPRPALGRADPVDPQVAEGVAPGRARLAQLAELEEGRNRTITSMRVLRWRVRARNDVGPALGSWPASSSTASETSPVSTVTWLEVTLGRWALGGGCAGRTRRAWPGVDAGPTGSGAARRSPGRGHFTGPPSAAPSPPSPQGVRRAPRRPGTRAAGRGGSRAPPSRRILVLASRRGRGGGAGT